MTDDRCPEATCTAEPQRDREDGLDAGGGRLVQIPTTDP
jgi:hypothetical protein